MGEDLDHTETDYDSQWHRQRPCLPSLITFVSTNASQNSSCRLYGYSPGLSVRMSMIFIIATSRTGKMSVVAASDSGSAPIGQYISSVQFNEYGNPGYPGLGASFESCCGEMLANAFPDHNVMEGCRCIDSCRKCSRSALSTILRSPA